MKLVRMLISIKSWSHLKLGQKLGLIRSNRRKPCVHSGRYSFDLIFMNLCQNVCQYEKRTDLKVGHVGSETRSLVQILEKSCVLSSRHSFDPICMKLCQNVLHHEMSDKIETNWVKLVKKYVIRSNQNCFYTLKV